MTHSPRLYRALFVTSLALASALGTGCLPRRAYDTCSVSADCPGTTQCLEITTAHDRICTTACTTDGSCPLDRYGTSGRCLSFDGVNSSCWQACAAGGGGSECPFGFDCFTSDGAGRTFPPICLPSRASSTPTQRPYENCTTSSQCLEATVCTTVNGLGMCSDTCSGPETCPLDRFGTTARCIAFGGAAATCFQACNISAGGAECSTGWGCYDNDGSSSFPPICLPN
ncbi:MAG: hypothetical protein U0353_14400 [Sandaracinus sp.]